MTSLSTLMYRITASLLYTCIGASERVQDLMQYPFENKGRQIFLPSATKRIWRFYERAVAFIYTSLFMILSCRFTLWLNNVSLPPTPPL